MAKVCLIRPGCTDFDEQHRIQGSLDLPLNPRGQQQVDQLIDQLRGLELKVIYTSVSEPARATANAIGDSLDVPVKELDGLRNFDQGLWQGLQIDEIRRKFPRVLKQWKESPTSICPPEGETVPEAVERVSRALRKPMKRRSTFAIVVSEPIATLVRCVIEDCELNTPGPICGDVDLQHLEILQVGGGGNAGDNGTALESADREPKQISAAANAAWEGPTQ